MSASASFIASKPACSACLRADTFGLTGFAFATLGTGLTTLGATVLLMVGAGCLSNGSGCGALGVTIAGSGFGVFFISKINVATRASGTVSGIFSNSGSGKYGMMTAKSRNTAKLVVTMRLKRASASVESSHGISITWLHVDMAQASSNGFCSTANEMRAKPASLQRAIIFLIIR